MPPGTFIPPIGSVPGSRYVNITTATTTIIKAGPGILRKIIFNKRIAAGAVTLFDNPSAASGTKLGTITMGAAIITDPPITALYDCYFQTGLVIVTSQAEDLTVIFD